MSNALATTAPVFKNGPVCPVTHERSVNSTLDFHSAGFHISYNPSTAGYGCVTTAIVIEERVFFVLNGDHCKALSQAAVAKGLQGCMDYFIEHIADASKMSEHLMVVQPERDVFSLIPTVLKWTDQQTIDRLSVAVNAPQAPVTIDHEE